MSIIKFAKSHEWARKEEDIAVIGLSDYAQGELGDIVFIEFPKVGESLTQGSQFGTIESTKAASELYAPLSGEVVEVNRELANNPQWVNQDPLAKGWMIKVKAANTPEWDSLMDEEAYKEFVAKEAR